MLEIEFLLLTSVSYNLSLLGFLYGKPTLLTQFLTLHTV